jgi:glutamyl-tRNA synthetase
MARQAGMRIVLRIEDLDTPRVKPGALEGLIQTLAWLGIDWDEPDATRGVVERAVPGLPGYYVQSRDLEPYRRAMRILCERAASYPCSLSRTEIEAAASAPQEGSHEVAFPLSLRPPCIARDFDAEPGTNWRLVVEPGEVAVHDRFAGARSFDVSRIVGDFVLWTKRDQPSYQLAVVVDDARQGVTHVIRGDDLLDSAARQLLVIRALDGTMARDFHAAWGVGGPSYTHLPLVVGADGRRLAKRHGDTRLDRYRELGVPAERVIGLIGFWCGLLPAPAGMSAAEFRHAFRLDTMPHGPVVFGPEDEQWLLTGASGAR